MTKSNNYLKSFMGFCFILLQASKSCYSEDLSSSIVRIYSGEKFLCSGTLVKANFVLTSAECLVWQKYPAALKVLGNVATDKVTKDNLSLVTKILRPADYNKRTSYMDVALLKLEHAISGENIKPAELCSKDSIEEGTPITVYHWGINDDSGVNINRNLPLRTLDIVVSDRKLCAERLKNRFSDTMFCAADNERIDCLYDKGGPATVDGKFCALYNYGLTCIEKANPGSFVPLTNSKVKKFIADSLQK